MRVFTQPGSFAEVRDRARNVGSRRYSGRKSAKSGPNLGNATFLVADADICAYRRHESEERRRFVFEKIENNFFAQNLETTSLLSGLSRDLRPTQRLPGNVDRLRLSGTRSFLRPRDKILQIHAAVVAYAWSDTLASRAGAPVGRRQEPVEP